MIKTPVALCPAIFLSALTAFSPLSVAWAQEAEALLSAKHTTPAVRKQDTEPGVLALNQAIVWALEKSPVLAASRSRADAAIANQSQAGALPNPEFSIEAENIYGDGPYDGTDGAEITYGLEQLVELPGSHVLLHFPDLVMQPFTVCSAITDDIRMGFMASLLSHSRPIHEMIRPNFQDQKQVFETQFVGMAFTPFSYDDFEATRERLVQEINQGWTNNDRAFLLGFKKGNPDWTLLPLENFSRMPAVQWKLLNIQKLIKQNPEKHAEQFKVLEDRLAG